MSATAEIADLIERVSLKDRNSFRELYERTNAKLFGVALRILNNRAEAEEALQEVYIKIWQRSDRFVQSQYSPMSWLIAIARNHCLDIVRARRPETSDIDEAFDIADDAPDPEKAAEQSGERSRIDGCLQQLPLDRADAVRMAYLDGYSYDELATKYKVPLNTMRTWLRRSLIKLKDCLQ